MAARDKVGNKTATPIIRRFSFFIVLLARAVSLFSVTELMRHQLSGACQQRCTDRAQRVPTEGPGSELATRAPVEIVRII